MKSWLIALGCALALLMSPPVQAQMTLDVAKVTCRQYLFDRTISPNAPTIAAWLSGYFNGKRDNTVIDIGNVRKNRDKVEDYCRMNLDITLIEAVRAVFGSDK